MGIVIASVATRRGGGSSIQQAAAAAGAAIERADITVDQVDALINVGIYRDSNMVEPAMAALIQLKTGVGLEYTTGRSTCLSFDLMNGACGVLNAVQVAQAMLVAEPLRHVVVVAGDTHPSMAPDQHPEFPITPVGAAMVLRLAAGRVGFGTLQVGAGDVPAVAEGYVHLPGMGSVGRGVVTLARTTTVEQLLAAAAPVARAALDSDDLDPARTVLICGRPTPEFGDRLAAELGFTAAVCLDRDAHTAALPAAYAQALDSGALADADAVLFVAAGAGPTAAAIGYLLPERG
jgi:3-oxoacyl-[acyl-carrier-protein] synthase-3